MKRILLAAGLVMFTYGFAQRTCGTTMKMKKFYEANIEAKNNRANVYKFLKTKSPKKGKSATSNLVTIPVVVHVLYDPKVPEMNISDEQILSQIKVLNDDFRKLNADFDKNVPDEFKGVAADMELAFCLAAKDPKGNKTDGIVRKAVDSNFDFENQYYQSKGSLAWDNKRYLNIWVGDIGDDYLGWAYMPDVYDYADDGLAIGYKYFGTTGAVVEPYNLGRTATHEIGHYFGLNHPWGDEYDSCGTEEGDDWCEDTPATFSDYYGTPKFPDFQYVCDESTPYGAMFMNYMDYVDDGVMGLFTHDQKTIVRNSIDYYRPQLINNNACSTMSTQELENFEAISVYPNPTSDFIAIKSPKVNINELEIFGSDGKVVKNVNLKNTSDKVDIKSLPVGLYYIRTYENGNFVKSLKFIKK